MHSLENIMLCSILENKENVKKTIRWCFKVKIRIIYTTLLDESKLGDELKFLTEFSSVQARRASSNSTVLNCFSFSKQIRTASAIGGINRFPI